MKQKELNLNERYKKLKQSDRMEYLAIDSVYQNRGNTFSMILFLSLSIKIFIWVMMMFTVFSTINMSAHIFTQTVGAFITQLFISILIVFSLMFLEIGTLFILGSNLRKRNKTLDEFLTDRKV